MNKIAIFFSLLAVHGAFAQQDRMRFPEGPASWTVIFEQKEKTTPEAKLPAAANPNDNGNSLQIAKTEVSQTDSVRRSVIHWSNGAKKEVWSFPHSDVIVTEEPSGGTIATRNDTLFGDPFSPSSFSWFGSAALTSEKPIEFQSKQCFHYKGAISVQNMVGAKMIQKTIPCEAWVDAKTLLPVAISQGDTLGKFTFGPPPDSLEMPDKFKKRLDYYKLTMGLK